MSKVLLVEDVEMNRDMLSRWLERRGCAVTGAVDGRSNSRAFGEDGEAVDGMNA